jgi:hypothetical protein
MSVYDGGYGAASNPTWQFAAGELFSLLSDDMPLAERSNLLLLDRQLHAAWGLGANVVLAWTLADTAIEALIVPHYAVAEFAEVDSHPEHTRRAGISQEFLRALLSGRRELSAEGLLKVARLLEIQPQRLQLLRPLVGGAHEREIIDRIVKRYSISYVASRAVALFDIVGFSLLSPFQQMTQLNSLSYSINAAHSRMLDRQIGINFARSCTGDGFYIWNRDEGLEANTSLYHFMHLVLADNAIARSKARSKAVPLLRAGFHIGDCYEFHQAEGLNPSLYNYIVGDVTIELARMIDRALPGQILVGEFAAHLDTEADTATPGTQLDAMRFMRLAQANLARLNGLELAGERIEAIKCYLTGQRTANGEYDIRRLTIADKHGLSRNVFNAKVNIYRRSAAPILLGLEDKVLASTAMAALSSHLQDASGMARDAATPPAELPPSALLQPGY